MAIENPTPSQLAIAAENTKTCEESLAQKTQQEAEEIQKKTKEMLDKAQQQLAALPEIIIGNINDAIKLLLSIINGYKDIDAPDYNPSVTIDQIKALLDPVIAELSSLPVPSIPGLSQISDLLQALKVANAAADKTAQQSQVATNSTNALSGDEKQQMKTAAKAAVKTDIPPEVMQLLQNLLDSLLALYATIPLVLINVIFQMLNAIIGMFKQIAGIIGVPSIPFPLNLVPNCISMIPDIMEFITRTPGKIMDVSYGTMRRIFTNISNMQVPQAPANATVPKQLPPCPMRDQNTPVNNS